MQLKLKVLTIAIIFTLMSAFVPIKVQGDTSPTLPKVAVHVSGYTDSKWIYTSWKYFQIYELLEEALRSDGTPFVEITDTEIESGGLLTDSGLPKYPILFSLSAECISSTEAQEIKEYVQAGGFAYAGSSSWTRKQDGTPYKIADAEHVSAVADSTWDTAGGSGEDPNYVASKTLDGDPNTFWLMDNNKYDPSTGLPVGDPINITFTFDVTYELQWVEVTQSSWTGNDYKTKDYEIWISPDGTSWSKAAQNTLPNSSAAVQQTAFSPTTAKKVRISVASVWVSQTANTGGLAEFKVVTTGTTPISIDPSSVAADSTWDWPITPGGDPRYVPEKTLDGDPNSQWFTDNYVYDSNGLPNPVPININYTFTNIHQINMVELTQTCWTGGGGLEYKTKNYEIWVSSDGSSWTKVAQNTLPGTHSAVQQNTFSPISAKKIRITITSVWESQVSHAAGLAEFKAYTTGGESIPGPPKFTNWLSNEMGIDNLLTYHEPTNPKLGGQDWWNSWSYVGTSGRGVLVQSGVSHRLVDHVPKGRRLLWILPQTYNSRPSGSTQHFAWATESTGATVLATFEWTGSVTWTSEGYRDIPLIAYKYYGSGCFIYHSEFSPLAGYGGFSVDSFTYAFFRKAIEWAFEANNVPLIRLAPWPYPSKAAFIIRLDGDGGPSDIMSYVAIDEARDVHGEYYIVTNTVSDPSLLTNAASHGAIIGSHSTYHTGPDSEGYSAAFNNIEGSLDDLESWLGNRPRIWVSPYYDAITEQAFQVIEATGLVSAGEQGVGPHPHFAMSMETEGKHYNFIELPTLEYFSDVMLDNQPILECDVPFYTNCNDPNGTMAKAIDFSYSMEGLIDIYAHFRSTSTIRRAFYIEYSKTKPDVWFTGSEDIYNWMLRRNHTSIAPTYESGSPDRINVAVSGPTDPGPFALDVTVPWSYETVVVKVNGVVTSNYENTGGKLRVSVGSPSQVEILLPHAEIESYHSSGIQDDEFVPGESICVKGSSFKLGNYPTYIVKDTSWSEPMAIPSRIAESSVTADSSGNVALTSIWSSATPGKYDIIVDVNGNNQYDTGIDVLLDNKVRITAGFFVIPEYALGTVLALAVCFAGVAVYRRSKQKKQRTL
jgi:hypothetical protein